MVDVQTTYYVMGIIFMSIMFAIMIGIIILLLYIKNKISQIHQQITDKIDMVSSVAQSGSEIASGGVRIINEAIKRAKDFKNNS